MKSYKPFNLETNVALNNIKESHYSYKASFKYDFAIDASQYKDIWEYFKDKKAALAISVGQPYHEESKLFSTISLLNKGSFKQCDVIIGDTLQRHNFIGKLGEKSAYNYTKKEGDRWIERNNPSLQKLKLNHTLIRWDELLNHKDYTYLKSLITNEFENNVEYRNAILSNIHTYLDRLRSCNPNVHDDLLIKNGLNYLLEEMPIVMPMWAQMDYDCIIYPKSITCGMKKTYELFVENNYPDKCKWVYLRFKKKNNYP